MITRLLLTLLFIASTVPVWGSDLGITDSRFMILEDDQGNETVSFILTVTWENSWRNARNHDAAWIFFKAGGSLTDLVHSPVAADGHRFIETPNAGGPAPEFFVPEDRMGLFVYPAEEYRGPVPWTLSVRLDAALLEQVEDLNFGKAFGLEMVYITEGPHWLGDPDPAALEQASFYRSGPEGEANGLYRVASEDQIEVGPNAGDLYYHSANEYHGDRQGPLPAAYPKGYAPFYIMKYELTQGQYAEFLNALSDGQSQHRANFGGRDYYENRGTLRIETGEYSAGSPGRPLNYGSWDDGMAYADWAGLRPMTELEFTKAARGGEEPVANQFPWGTGSSDAIQRFVDREGDLVMAAGLNESMLSDGNREIFGASYYWVMDLAGSIWERVVTVGHPAGRSFRGTHGDGQLTGYGFATNEDWPSGHDGREGIGFRGGGFYYPFRDYHEFNPHSPVAWRPYGAWAGWNRTVSYGQRFVRTAQ